MQKRRGLTGLLVIFVFLLVVSPWGVRWIQRTFLSPELMLQVEREVAIPYSGNWDILPGNEGVFLIRNAEIRYVTPRQEDDWAFGTETLVPVAGGNREHVYLMESSPRYLLRINEAGHMLYQQAANRSAESISVGDENYLVLQHPPENRLTPFSILDPDGRVMGSILLTEGEVLNTMIDSSQNRVFISVLRLIGNGYETVLLGYDLQGVLQTSKSFANQVMMDMTVNQEGELALLTDQALLLYTVTMEEVWRQPVEPYYLSRYDDGANWVLAHRGEYYQEALPSESSVETVLTHIDLNRREITVFVDSEDVSALTVRGDRILTRTPRGIKLFRQGGDVVDEQMFQDEVEDAFLLAGNRIAVQRRGQIVFYQLKTDN